MPRKGANVGQYRYSAVTGWLTSPYSLLASAAVFLVLSGRWGVPRAVSNYFTCGEQIMIADVPVKGVTTIYS